MKLISSEVAPSKDTIYQSYRFDSSGFVKSTQSFENFWRNEHPLLVSIIVDDPPDWRADLEPRCQTTVSSTPRPCRRSRISTTTSATAVRPAPTFFYTIFRLGRQITSTSLTNFDQLGIPYSTPTYVVRPSLWLWYSTPTYVVRPSLWLSDRPLLCSSHPSFHSSEQSSLLRIRSRGSRTVSEFGYELTQTRHHDELRQLYLHTQIFHLQYGVHQMPLRRIFSQTIFLLLSPFQPIRTPTIIIDFFRHSLLSL